MMRRGFRFLWFTLWLSVQVNPTLTRRGWRLQLIDWIGWRGWGTGRFSGGLFYYLRLGRWEIRAWPPGAWARVTGE